MDADFCAQFIQMMHSQGTPGFHTLGCYDKVDFFFFFRIVEWLFTCSQLLGDHVKVVLFSCSEYEARNYGLFIVKSSAKALIL
jgi:THO complex subunit 2